jgi:DNA-binding CsgD family transcriptional regulator
LLTVADRNIEIAVNGVVEETVTPIVTTIDRRVGNAAEEQRLARTTLSNLIKHIEKGGYAVEDVRSLFATVAAMHLQWWVFAREYEPLEPAQRLSARIEATFWANALIQMHVEADLATLYGGHPARAAVEGFRRAMENSHVRAGILMIHGLTEDQRTGSAIVFAGNVRAMVDIRPVKWATPGSTQRERALAHDSGLHQATPAQLRTNLNNNLLGASFVAWRELSTDASYPSIEQIVSHVTRDVESGALPDKKVNRRRVRVEALPDDFDPTSSPFDDSTFELRDMIERATARVALSPLQRLVLRHILSDPSIQGEELASRAGISYASFRQHKGAMQRKLMPELEKTGDLTFTRRDV